MRTDTHAITDRSPCRQPLWTADELALLDRLAPGKPRKEALVELFPGRSLPAIRLRLHQARRKLGISLAPPEPVKGREYETTMLDRDDPGVADNWPKRWSAAAASSNSQFLAALQRLAA